MKNFDQKNEARSLDMAIEAHSLLRGQDGHEISGVTHSEEPYSHGKITTIQILSDEGARQMGRGIGTYITIETPGLREATDLRIIDSVSAALADALHKLLPKGFRQSRRPVLLVGLGNSQTTADAIGPRVISHIQPTRHFFADNMTDELSPVAAFVPGVVGNTGIETAALIKGAVEEISPCCLIAIDALAARTLSNIASGIQLCNTGIRPGSGVQNHRQAINSEYLGIPVIAIGIPTVVHAAGVIRESVNACLKILQISAPELPQKLADELLQPFDGNLIVTPKEADQLIPLAARIIAAGLTRALHPGAGPKDFRQYMQGI